MANGRIVVFGSYINDLVGRGPHLPRPGETLKGSSFQTGPGGKGFNQAVAAKRTGSEVLMVTKVGLDSFGELAISNFKKEGIPTRYVFRDSQAPTGAALIVVHEETGENQILVTMGACGRITEEEVESGRKDIEKASLVLTQFETNMDATERCISIAKKVGVPVILNPAPMQEVSDDILAMVDIVTPNEIEASMLSGVEISDLTSTREAAKLLLAKGVKKVVITLGKKGVYACADDEELVLPAVGYAPVVDTTGAGDAFNGALATGLAEGMGFFEAVKFSNVAASLSTTRYGAAQSMAYRKEVEKYLKI